MRNVVHEPRNAEIVGDLAARLEKWMRDTGDPLLDGPVPPPPGAEINDPDQRSGGRPSHRRRRRRLSAEAPSAQVLVLDRETGGFPGLESAGQIGGGVDAQLLE